MNSATTAQERRLIPDAAERLLLRMTWFQAAEADLLRDDIICVLLDDSSLHARQVLAEKHNRDLMLLSDQAYSVIGTTADYLRELWWIANGQLEVVLREGIADRSSLARMTMNAEVLPVARKMFDEGVPAFESDLSALMRKKQGDTWTWLCDEVLANRLQSFALEKYVATWKREARRDDIILADSPAEAQRMAETKWRIPGEMIAVTLVESLFD